MAFLRFRFDQEKASTVFKIDRFIYKMLRHLHKSLYANPVAPVLTSPRCVYRGWYWKKHFVFVHYLLCLFGSLSLPVRATPAWCVYLTFILSTTADY